LLARKSRSAARIDNAESVCVEPPPDFAHRTMLWLHLTSLASKSISRLCAGVRRSICCATACRADGRDYSRHHRCLADLCYRSSVRLSWVAICMQCDMSLYNLSVRLCSCFDSDLIPLSHDCDRPRRRFVRHRAGRRFVAVKGSGCFGFREYRSLYQIAIPRRYVSRPCDSSLMLASVFRCATAWQVIVVCTAQLALLFPSPGGPLFRGSYEFARESRDKGTCCRDVGGDPVGQLCR